MTEKENQKCALALNSLIYELQENGHTDNALANGLIFSLSIHMINAKFNISEIVEQLKKLHKNIKSELGQIDDHDIVEFTSEKAINPQWD